MLVNFSIWVLAQAGGGSGSFGGGGGGGGGSGGGGAGSGSSEGDPIVVAVFFGIFGLVIAWILLKSWRYHQKVKAREAHVHTASAEAAEAWDARDRGRLGELVGEELMVEWSRRLDDFDRKGWHNRVEVLGEPTIQYVGMENREDDTTDRVVVRIEASLRSYVLTKGGEKVMRSGESDEQIGLVEYWTLARRDGRWVVASIEQKAEGDHHLDSEIVASPWSDTTRLRDESLTELAVEDEVPEGFTTADLAELDFSKDARAHALDLSVADARFSPDVLEAAARRAVAAWAEAVDGEDAALEAVAAPEAVSALLYPGDPARKTRLVVRGPRVRSILIEAVDVSREPATMTIEVALHGSRYVEDRDTTTVVSGSKDSAGTFSERWTLALSGPDDAPWQLVGAG